MSHWQCLTDPVLLKIFSYLDEKDLFHCAECCVFWNRVARDEFLWKSLFYKTYRVSRAPANSFEEYKRLFYYSPTILTETLPGHTNHIFHVNFSYDGTMFATCSDDGFFKVWKHYQIYKSVDMKKFGWNRTGFSEFNESDTMLMVFGTSAFGKKESIIFSIYDETISNVKKQLCTWYDDKRLIYCENGQLGDTKCIGVFIIHTGQITRMLLLKWSETIERFVVANRNNEKYLIFFAHSRIGFKRIEISADLLEMDHSIDIEGYIIGIAISTDHKHLYVNVKSSGSEVQTRVINLLSFDVGVLHMYKEFRFIPVSIGPCLKFCDEFALCGRNYLLDTRYGIRMSSDRFFSIAFNPKDPEMLISTKDDFTVKIWRSRNKVKVL